MNIKHSYIDSLWIPGWFKARAELYQKVSTWEEKKVDEVFFDFSKPYAGWIDMSIYSDGKHLHTFPMSAAFDPFHDMKIWMEDVANDLKLSTNLYMEVEGRIILFHYEHISLAEVGVSRKFVHEEREKDKWEKYDAITDPDMGLFFVYDTDTESIPVACFCKTKQLLFALYSGLLEYASKSASAPLIKGGWYYLDNSYDNWTLYNTIKSPLIEWSIYSDHGYRHLRPTFKSQPTIKETVHMWAEWGDALFWHQRGGCCGNAEKFYVDTNNTEIDLSSIPEVRNWYDEFDSRAPEVPWEKEGYEAWLNRGWELAKKIRLLLPESVDLFYEWRNFKDIPSKYGMGRHIPYIVPDLRTIKTDKSWFNLLLF